MTYPPAGQNQPYGQPGIQQPESSQQQPGYQQPGYQQQGYQQPGYGPISPDGGRAKGALAHLLGGIFGWLAALITWLVTKDQGPIADAEGKKALNFQITLIVASFALGVLLMISIVIAALTQGIGLILTVVIYLASIGLALVSIVYGIINFNRVNRAEQSSYPYVITFIK